MADPTLSYIDHGLEGWDAIHNGNVDLVNNNFALKNKSALSGQASYLDHAEVTTGALSGATKTLSNLIPAGCILLGVTVRVTTTITGATSFTIGDGTTADLFGTGVALPAGTTTSLLDHKTTWAPKFYKTVGDVVLTAVGSNFTGGNVRVTVHYMKLTPPTV